jgi:hypothetical protein
MANSNEVSIKIRIDSDTGALILTRNELDKLSGASKEASETIIKHNEKTAASYEGMGNALANTAHSLDILKAGFFGIKGAYEDTIGYGIKVNSTFEDMRIGIAALAATNFAASIQGAERFSTGLALSASVLEDLKKANLETPATLEQLGRGFQAALAPALAYGMSIKQTIEYTKLMTIAAGAMQVPMEQLSQEMRSILSGDITNDSLVAKALRITNKDIEKAKEAGKLFELLTGKLNDFKYAGEAVQTSFSGSMSNLKDAVAGFASEMTSGIFDNSANRLQSLAKWFNAAASSASDFFATLRDPKNLNSQKQLNAALIDVAEKIDFTKGNRNWINSWGTDIELKDLGDKQKELLKRQDELNKGLTTSFAPSLSDKATKNLDEITKKYEHMISPLKEQKDLLKELATYKEKLITTGGSKDDIAKVTKDIKIVRAEMGRESQKQADPWQKTLSSRFDSANERDINDELNKTLYKNKMKYVEDLYTYRENAQAKKQLAIAFEADVFAIKSDYAEKQSKLQEKSIVDYTKLSDEKL